MSNTPGGPLATRPLHFIWIVDCSGSMSFDGKIQALNRAVREALPGMVEVAEANPNADVLVRVLAFSNGARWVVSQPTPVADFKWTDLSADGETHLGQALSMVAEALKMPPMTDRGLPPVLALLSDGQPTDDYTSGLRALMDQPWGKKSVRIAIAIGEDADLGVLQKFIGDNERQPLRANNPDALLHYIHWTSTDVLKAASSPASQSNASTGSHVPVPVPVAPGAGPSSALDIW